MKVRIYQFFDDVKSSYWFLPAVMGLASVVLSFITINLDNLFQAEVLSEVGFLWSGGPEGARNLLSTVAGSMINVAGVTFSITIVALALASSQFGPRLLRSFMRDTGNQVVLGMFTSTFVYCLLVLRTIRGQDEILFVPQISITVSILLALASLGVLIYFIHHLAVAIQAPQIIGEVADDMMANIDRLFPGAVGLEPEQAPDGRISPQFLELFNEQAEPVMLSKAGYVQAIDDGRLMQIAREHDLIVRIHQRPGKFISDRQPVMHLYPRERVKAGIKVTTGELFIIGRERTHTQDIEFAFHQLVEAAMRALSPAYNDPFTAMTCIDWIGAGLSRLAGKPFPSPYRYDENGSLRLIVDSPVTFPGLVNAAFDQIRQAAGPSAVVRMRLLEVISIVLQHAVCSEDRQALFRQAAMIRRASQSALPEQEDILDIERRYRRLKEIMEKPVENSVERGKGEK